MNKKEEIKKLKEEIILIKEQLKLITNNKNKEIKDLKKQIKLIENNKNHIPEIYPNSINDYIHIMGSKKW